MTIEIARMKDHEDGSTTGLLYRFDVFSSYGREEVEVRLILVARVDRPSKRHKLKWGDKWDSSDERYYNSAIRRRELLDLVPQDVIDEALSKVKVKVVIPAPAEGRP